MSQPMKAQVKREAAKGICGASRGVGAAPAVRSEVSVSTAALGIAPIDVLLEWADGDSSDRNVPITLADDLENEPEQTFNLRPRDPAPAGGLALGVISGSVVSIERVFSVRVSANGFEG